VRYLPLAIFSRIALPVGVIKNLRYVPTAVLAAIIFPALIYPNGHLDLSASNEYLVAGLLAALVAWYSHNLTVTVLTGIAVLWLWRFWA
jgi:branched-subunit amino acid transport protein